MRSRPQSLKELNLFLSMSGSIRLAKGSGYFYIYSDEGEMGLKIAGLYSSSIYVSRLRDFTIQRWLEEINDLFNEEINRPLNTGDSDM